MTQAIDKDSTIDSLKADLKTAHRGLSAKRTTITALRLEVDQLKERSTVALSDLKADAEKYTVLSADELLSCWALTRAYLKDLPNNDSLSLKAIKEKFAEHVSLQRRLECRIELLQSRKEWDPSC